MPGGSINLSSLSEPQATFTRNVQQNAVALFNNEAKLTEALSLGLLGSKGNREGDLISLAPF
jgi:hypothetical protein